MLLLIMCEANSTSDRSGTETVEVWSYVHRCIRWESQGLSFEKSGKTQKPGKIETELFSAMNDGA